MHICDKVCYVYQLHLTIQKGCQRDLITNRIIFSLFQDELNEAVINNRKPQADHGFYEDIKRNMEILTKKLLEMEDELNKIKNKVQIQKKLTIIQTK